MTHQGQNSNWMPEKQVIRRLHTKERRRWSKATLMASLGQNTSGIINTQITVYDVNLKEISVIKVIEWNQQQNTTNRLTKSTIFIKNTPIAIAISITTYGMYKINGRTECSKNNKTSLIWREQEPWTESTTWGILTCAAHTGIWAESLIPRGELSSLKSRQEVIQTLS